MYHITIAAFHLSAIRYWGYMEQCGTIVEITRHFASAMQCASAPQLPTLHIVYAHKSPSLP